MAYEDLSKAERALVDEYRGLRSISDWAGFSDAQRKRLDNCRRECEERRKAIWRAAEGKTDGQPKGWATRKRRQRYASLQPAALRVGNPRHEVRLPAAGCTPYEKALVEEREFYLAIPSQTPGQRKRKQANVDELVRRRKQLYGLTKRDAKKANRGRRYENLCVATKHGTPYKDWDKTHLPDGTPKPEHKARSTRQLALHWQEQRQGYSEQPPGSNTDTRQDGIRTAQIKCGGGSHALVGTAWCGEWSWRSFDAAGVPDIGEFWMASVAAIENAARAGRACYRGWNSGFNTAGVQEGDQVVIGGFGVHVATVLEVRPDGVWTREGNTSSNVAGSQSNGGWAGKRWRPAFQVHGFAKVDHAIV